MTTWTQEAADAITAWQNAGYVHPLTCGNNSNHLDLVPQDNGGQLVLICLNCTYVQENIPAVCLNGPPPNPLDFGQ